MHTHRAARWALALAWPIVVAAYDRPAPTKTQIAEGVFLFQTAPYGDVGLDGNSIAIVGRDGVLVFDTNGTPSAASAVLGELEKITSKRVKYIVNSHWHWDHWYGTEVYKAAFPDVEIVAQEKTRAMMMGPALEFNKPGVEVQLPQYVDSLRTRVRTAEATSPPPANLPRLKQALADAEFFLQQKASVHHTFPTKTFADRLTLSLGDREVQVLHYSRAVTPGDALLYLPNERIVITGDLLVNPISFALSCYPTEWLQTLEKIDALDARIIVPGHGAPLRDETLLHATMDVFRLLLREGKAAKAKGLDPDQARQSIAPMLHDLMVTITGNDPAKNEAFNVQLVDWYLHRVYDELNGPLGDEIAAIPKS
jgi:glyoxylase-like metal-dependent hydrolase (beta-lactamase superfamily II)